MTKTYYDILQVNNNADLSVIKAAYKVLIQKYHPDKNNELKSLDITKEINKAYDVLSNPKERKIYDLYLAQQNIEKNKELEEQIRLNEQKKYNLNNSINVQPINNEYIYWQHILAKHKEIQQIENQYILNRKRKNKKMFLFSISIYILTLFLIFDFFFHITKINYSEMSNNSFKYISSQIKKIQQNN